MYDGFLWTRISARRNELTKAYEPVQPLVLLGLARALKAKTFFDIGANIGVYSIVFAADDGIDSVLAFEPMPDCCVEIDCNARLNGTANKIKTIQVALSDTHGEARFRKIAAYSGGNGLTSTHLFTNNNAEEINVPLRELDNESQVRNGSIAMKVDVEGHEYNVLAGARNILSQNTGVLQIEIHESSPNHGRTIELLQECGWSKLWRIGWDYYFSNAEQCQNDAGRLALIEKAMDFVVDQSLNSPRPARRHLMNGVTLEVSRSRVNDFKRLIRIRG